MGMYFLTLLVHNFHNYLAYALFASSDSNTTGR